MKRAAWLASLVAVAALASAGCALQVAGQGQDEQQVGTTGQGLGQDQTGAAPAPTNSLNSADDGTGSDNTNSGVPTGGDPAKPTPDPWRNGLLSPAKPTPDPWRPHDTTSTSGGSSQNGSSNPSGTTQTGTTHSSTR